MCDQSYYRLQTYKTYIKSSRKLKKYVQKITGITDEMLKDADDFPDAISKFISWANNYDDILVVSWGNTDKKALVRQLNRYHILVPDFVNNWKDIQKDVTRELTLLKKQLQLQDVVETLGICVDGHMHDALQDAVCLADILFLRQQNSERYVNKTLSNNKFKYLYELNTLRNSLIIKLNRLNSDIQCLELQVSVEGHQESEEKRLRRLMADRDRVEQKLDRYTKEINRVLAA